MIGSASRRESEKYAVSGGIAEEVIGSIRTVVSFNGQRHEAERYETSLLAGQKDGIKKSLYTGVGMAVTFIVMFSTYSLCFWCVLRSAYHAVQVRLGAHPGGHDRPGRHLHGALLGHDGQLRDRQCRTSACRARRREGRGQGHLRHYRQCTPQRALRDLPL